MSAPPHGHRSQKRKGAPAALLKTGGRIKIEDDSDDARRSLSASLKAGAFLFATVTALFLDPPPSSQSLLGTAHPVAKKKTGSKLQHKTDVAGPSSCPR